MYAGIRTEYSIWGIKKEPIAKLPVKKIKTILDAPIVPQKQQIVNRRNTHG